MPHAARTESAGPLAIGRLGRPRTLPGGSLARACRRLGGAAPLGRSPTRLGRLGWLGALGQLGQLCIGAALLTACPAPLPGSETARRDPFAPAKAPEPAAPAPAKAEPAAEPVPAEARPAAEAVVGDPASPVAPSALSLPPALAAEGVRPVVRTLWSALEAVDSGDTAAMAAAMTDAARWYPPGRFEESVGGAADLQRALGPWGNDGFVLDVRRIVDPGDGPFVAQVTVGDRERPTLRSELVLLVEPSGDRIGAVHHFGDPLGPVRLGPSKQEPLDLGPVGEPTLERGAPDPAHVTLARALTTAVDAREDDAVRPRLAEAVVLHDLAARRTRQGRDGWVTGMRETLGETGHLVVDRHLAGAGFVILQGAVYGREPASKGSEAEAKAETKTEPEPEPQEHGFVDVHRIVDGTVAETWHYVNRRGRPHRSRLRP